MLRRKRLATELACGAQAGVRYRAMPLAAATWARRAILAIVVAQDEPGPRAVRGGLAQLLRRLLARGVMGDIDVQQPSRAEFYEEEGEQRPDREIREQQDVAGPDLVRVVAQERRPGLAGSGPADRSEPAYGIARDARRPFESTLWRSSGPATAKQRPYSRLATGVPLARSRSCPALPSCGRYARAYAR